ncbi:MAG: alpha/beta hydrolase [Thermoanaerobaculia bacterium]|nr:alpha/beta hydrolase [Thermoanaerobaculia bacterium]
MSLHQGGTVVAAGAPLATARAAVVALHGRGATAPGIADFLAAELDLASAAIVAPQARHGTWYPQSFLAPFAANQPWLDSALARVGEVVAEVEAAGIPAARIVLFGFSQGACLASEFAARQARRYGALVAATGGRIGPPGTVFASDGDLAGTPVHLSSGDPDPHVPWARVEETAASLTAMGAAVTAVREPGFPHAVHPDAVRFLREIVAAL